MPDYSIGINKNNKYVIYGRTIVTTDFTDRYIDQFPNDGLLPYDGVYPAYRIYSHNSFGAIINTETILIGALKGTYDILHTMSITDDTESITIDFNNCSVDGLYYNEISGSLMRFKQGDHYETVINAWCKVDNAWRPIDCVFAKVNNTYKIS